MYRSKKKNVIVPKKNYNSLLSYVVLCEFKILIKSETDHKL